MKIDKMERIYLRQIEAEIKAALEPVAAAWGLELRVGGGRFDMTSYAPKIELCIKSADGINAKLKHEFEMLAHIHGIDQGAIGREFDGVSGRYVLIGGNTKKFKRPFLARHLATGKEYVFPPELIRARFPAKRGGGLPPTPANRR